MRVVVDPEACECYGECVLAAPHVFDLGDDDDIVRVLDPEPPESLHEAVEAAVQACPSGAIRADG